LSTPERLFDELLRARPADPFVTYYDEASGERSELSAKSLANWVAKTHHLLVDELDLAVGDSARVPLPAHWITVSIVLGCLTAGLQFVDEGPVDVTFDTRPGTRIGPPHELGVYVEPADLEYVSAVRPQADTWAGVQLGASETDPCLPGLSREQVVAAARERAATLGLPQGARVLSTREWTSSADWLDTLFAPLAVGGSVVYVANCTDDLVIERRAAQERVTIRV
jgi:hypothetical protein